MHFRILGPLEVFEGDQQVALGGVRQRATLGYLLLQPNRVVATSQLMNALWPCDVAPSSARKILQNAVWGLRHGVLAAGDCAGRSVELVTQDPGYLLKVDSSEIDLHRFTAEVDQGRAQLASGSPHAAAVALRRALSLWRGPVLADLVENGISWPELSAVQNARLDATEDYFEAELACGRHQAVLRELEAMVEAEPLRERLCGQLMLALYRSGRQADALHVYARVRSVLVDRAGLEPGAALQKLQHAILNHEPELALPMGGRLAMRLVEQAESTVTAPVVEQEGRRDSVAARRHVSVVLIRAQFEPVDGDAVFEGVAEIVQDELDRAGDVLTTSIGSLSLAVFGVPERRHDDATRAVRTALRVRERLAAIAARAPQSSFQIAVGTGNAVVGYRPGRSDGVRVVGALLGECERLLSAAPAGGVRVCEVTRRSAPALAFRRPDDGEPGWFPTGGVSEQGLAVDRERELQTLYRVLEQTRHAVKPHLVTILGEPGVGKSRFVADFERRFATQPSMVRFLSVHTPAYTDNAVAGLQAEVLASCCGILPDDTQAAARARLGKTISRLALPESEREWLFAELGLLLDPRWLPVAAGKVRTAWMRLLEVLSARRPIVLVITKLHQGDDALLDYVETLTDPSWQARLLVVVTARPELLKRRPEWGGGQRHGVTITLDLLPDATIDHLLDSLLTTMDGEFKDTVDGLFNTLPPVLRQEPTVRRRYLRWLLAPGCADTAGGDDCCEDEPMPRYNGSLPNCG